MQVTVSIYAWLEYVGQLYKCCRTLQQLIEETSGQNSIHNDNFFFFFNQINVNQTLTSVIRFLNLRYLADLWEFNLQPPPYLEVSQIHNTEADWYIVRSIEQQSRADMIKNMSWNWPWQHTLSCQVEDKIAGFACQTARHTVPNCWSKLVVTVIRIDCESMFLLSTHVFNYMKVVFQQVCETLYVMWSIDKEINKGCHEIGCVI